VLLWLGKLRESGGASQSAPTILEIGTGSGAIALSLAREAGARVVATDLSRDALAVASANARRLGLESGIEFRTGDLWQPVHPGERFDVIVSNPPYVAEADAHVLQPEVREWEPGVALYGGRDGLRVIEPLVSGAASRLRPGGLLALEVGADQAQAVAGLLAQSDAFTHIRVQLDLAGRERVVLAESQTR
jgi:release factor glutamine methyltransferase